MPIYEYQCDACGHDMEAIQKMSDPPLADCPACGKPSLRRKISAVGFRLKGSGWYETDFKSDNRRNVAGDADGGKSKATEGGEAKTADKADSASGSKAKSGTDTPAAGKSAAG